MDLRSQVENLDVQHDDYIVVYDGDEGHGRRGTHHRRDDLSLSVDIRSADRARAWALKEECIRILEKKTTYPDPYSEWDQAIIENVAHPHDFSDFQHYVIDLTLLKHARTMTTPKALS